MQTEALISTVNSFVPDKPVTLKVNTGLAVLSKAETLPTLSVISESSKFKTFSTNVTVNGIEVRFVESDSGDEITAVGAV